MSAPTSGAAQEVVALRVLGGRLDETGLRSGNVWLGNTDGVAALADTFTTGIMKLPRNINSVYLISETLAGFRDIMGPFPNVRGTISKCSLAGTEEGEVHNESLYRPHLYTTLPRTDVSRIDFHLADSSGIVLDLEGSNLSFIVTFDDSHLLA